MLGYRWEANRELVSEENVRDARLVPGFGLALLLVSVLCAGQSLGDAARQSRQQKETRGTAAKKVYTTDDMTAPTPAHAHGFKDLSGTWTFTHFEDRFQGWIDLRQSGSALEGTWHTSSGKSEPDTLVTGRIDGTAVTLRRSIGSHEQSSALTLSADGSGDKINIYWKWFHVCEHESHHTGQIAFLTKRLPGAKAAPASS